MKFSINEKLNNISDKNSKRLIILFIILCFLNLLLIRYIQNNSIKIMMLYTVNLLAMISVFLYKRSINKYEIFIFFFLCIQLFALAPKPSELNSLASTTYLLSYRYGVSSRSLIATIIDFLTNGGFISKYFVWNFILSSTVFLSFIIAVLIGSFLVKYNDEKKIFFLFLSFLYLSCFTSPAAYYIQPNFGRIEIFALLFSIFVVIIIEKPLLKWLIPLFSLFIIATHLILLFFYIPLIIIVLLYEILLKEVNRKQIITLLIVTILTISSAFLLYILFYQNTFVFEDANIFSEYLKTKTDLRVGFVHIIMYGGLQDHLARWNYRVHIFFPGNLTIIINLPLLLLFTGFWVKCFLAEVNKLMKYFFLLPMLTILFQFVSFFMFFDFGRWMIMMLNIQFILVFYLIHKENKTVLQLAEKIVPLIKRNSGVIILIFFTMLFLGPVREIAPSRTLEGIASFIRDFMNYIR